MLDTAKRIERAERALQKGKPELALAEYLAILEENPTNVGVCHTAADVCVSLGRNNEAVELLNSLFKRQCEGSDKANAAITYKKLSRITRPTGEQSLTFAHSLAKNEKEALKAYQAALQVFIAKNRKREAFIALSGIVALAPSIDHFRQQGELAAELDLKPEAAAAYLAAGELEKDEDAKCVLFERAHSLHPQDSRIALAYADTLLARHCAEKAAVIAKPFTTGNDSAKQARYIYGRAMLAAKQPAQAIPFLWELFEHDPNEWPLLSEAISALAASDDPGTALQWIRNLERHQTNAGQRRKFIEFIKSLNMTGGIEVLEYLATLFDSANREHDYSDTLLKLFDLHYASANYDKAASCLDRAVEVDAYEPGHAARLERLRNKINTTQFKAIAARLSGVVAVQPADASVPSDLDAETTSLDDLLLQAQIYSRYAMQAKAVQKLKTIQKLFPGEEENNLELRDLYEAAGLSQRAPAPAEPPAPSHSRVSDAAIEPPPSADGISRLTEITTNLYRQSTVKNVLFACVNDVGRHWEASRCLAVLSTPGKPPSIAIEFCAPGLAKSDIHSIVKQVGILQPLLVAHGILNACTSESATPSVAQLQKILPSWGVRSLLAVPLVDGTEHIGVLALSQCDSSRNWSKQDAAVLNAIAEQAVLAVSNARLRKLVHDLAVTEEKSGLVKRSSYLDVLVSEVKRALQVQTPLTLMLMNFRGSAGSSEDHPAGLDRTMQHLGHLIKSHIRQNDVAVRYDATTVALILGDTDSACAQQAAERLRRVVAVASFPGITAPPTISIGIAESVLQSTFDAADIVTEAVNRAERSLAGAVAVGANQTITLNAPVHTTTDPQPISPSA